MMLSVRLGLGVLLVLLCGCQDPVAVHGPVSATLMSKLDRDAVTRAGVMKKITSGEMRVSLAAPEQPTITLPFDLEDGTPRIKVGINTKKKVEMVVDTGAVKTMIPADLAAAAGVTMIREEDASVSMRGVIGDEKGRVGILEPLQIGAWSLYGYPCVVRTHQNSIRGVFLDVSWNSNLLGFDVSARLASYLTLDYRKERVTWGFRQPFVPPAGKRVSKGPFKIINGVPFVPIKCGGETWQALVDTGSFNGIEINQAMAERMKLGKGQAVEGLYLMSVGGSTTSGAAGLRTVTVPSITILGDTYRQAQVDVSPGVPRIGSYFFKDYRVTFDFRRKLLWLEW